MEGLLSTGPTPSSYHRKYTSNQIKDIINPTTDLAYSDRDAERADLIGITVCWGKRGAGTFFWDHLIPGSHLSATLRLTS